MMILTKPFENKRFTKTVDSKIEDSKKNANNLYIGDGVYFSRNQHASTRHLSFYRYLNGQ
jgi:hypothetical protein